MKKSPRISREEFIKREALKAGVSQSMVRKHFMIVRCYCGHWVCSGWITIERIRKPGNRPVHGG